MEDLHRPRQESFVRNYIKKKYIQTSYKLKNKNIAFSELSPRSNYKLIISTGRTGTVYLSNILKSIGVHVTHEPCELEPYLHRYRSEEKSYFDDFGSYKLNQITKYAGGRNLYCEINPYMRSFIDDIRIVYPQLTVLGIYRPGIEVIASMYARGTLTDKDNIYKNLSFDHPSLQESDEEYRWFEKLCYYWLAQMKETIEHSDIIISFTEVINLESNGSSTLCNFLNDEKIDFVKATTRTHNETPENLKLNLDSKHQRIFERICGEFEFENMPS